MKHTTILAGALGLLMAAPAFAQTAAQTPTPTGSSQPAHPVAQGVTQQASPRPDASAPATTTAPAAVSSSDNPRTTAAPVPGANSFTEGQARSRIEEKGFGNVTELKKDDKGVWRANAMKDGRTVTVSLDYQGNVVAN